MSARVIICFRVPRELSHKSSEIIELFRSDADEDSYGVRNIQYAIVQPGEPFFHKYNATYQLSFEGDADPEMATGEAENIVQDRSRTTKAGEEFSGYIVENSLQLTPLN